MKSVLFLILTEIMTVPSVPIDPARIKAEEAADADVLRSLQQNGDVPSISRPVDVRFVGGTAEVDRLHKAVGAMGWRIIQRVPLDGGQEALDVQRDQTTDQSAILSLTKAALALEAQFAVRCDGWGTVATKR